MYLMAMMRILVWIISVKPRERTLMKIKLEKLNSIIIIPGK